MKTIFALAVGLVSAASIASGQMSIRRTPGAIIVGSSAGAGWRLKLDLKQGGVATDFQVPASGPNLTYGRGWWTGLFNVYVGGGKPAPSGAAEPGEIERLQLKGNGRVDMARVLASSPTRIVVEVNGHACGWGNYGRTGETVIEYRHRFLFEPRQIGFHGEVTWVCGHGTKPDDLELEDNFAPHAVQWPIRLVGADGRARDLEVAGSDGEAFPPGVGYPATAQIWFRGGACILLRTEEVPPEWRAHPWLLYERPWQRSWKQVFGFAGEADLPPARRWYPAHTPLRYGYSIRIPSSAPAGAPPEVHIVSPVRGSDFFKDPDIDVYSALRYSVGETVRLAAVAQDANGCCLPSSAFHWSINWGANHRAATGAGSQIFFTLPRSKAKFYWIEVSARDSQGSVGEDYITFKVAK
ncbi:MAG: hypothetical protein ACREFX_11595 [Opitutaceae bacterium]